MNQIMIIDLLELLGQLKEGAKCPFCIDYISWGSLRGPREVESGVLIEHHSYNSATQQLTMLHTYKG